MSKQKSWFLFHWEFMHPWIYGPQTHADISNYIEYELKTVHVEFYNQSRSTDLKWLNPEAKVLAFRDTYYVYAAVTGPIQNRGHKYYQNMFENNGGIDPKTGSFKIEKAVDLGQV